MALVDAALWRTLSPLLDRALELEGAARTAFVDALGAAEPEVAAVLARLLADHDRAAGSGFLESAPDVDAAPSFAGQALGPYALIEPLGMGGMGAVWRARRSDGRFEGDVAIKLLHPSLLDRDGEDRFRREGTILSRFTHPGIARLFDAGVSAAGQPYLVLELVVGSRIDHYADERRLGVRERLELFLQVAEAVAHAHASLVVHRDLKPSNILVDREGRMKLLDFGIASLVDGSSGSARTLTAARALTPEFAAPEQLDGRPITTATDVYALGVLLYELLAGRHPTLGDDVTPAGLLRAVTQTVPVPMSESVARSDRRDARGGGEDGGETRFAARATTRQRLARRLAGDLDTIVARALKKEPGERYATVAAMADDLRRHLADLPVRARPDSAWYRLRKLVARHRLETGAAAVVALALLAAAAIALAQARASDRQRDRALADLRRAEITNDFSSFLLSEAPAGGAANAPEELLRRGETMIDRRFARDPALQAHLLLLLADLYEERRESAEAGRVTARAFALAESGADRRVRALAACHLALEALRSGDAARADALFAGALADLARESDSGREEARCRMFEGHVAYRRRDYERSIRANERALELERRRPGPPGRGLDVLNELGSVYAAVGRGLDSDRRFGELFAEFEAQGRERTQPAYLANTNWAVALQRAGQPVRAASRWRTAVDIARELDPVNGASSFELTGLAILLPIVGQYEEAIAMIDEALAKSRTEGDAAVLFEVLIRAGRIHSDAGRLEAADRFLTEAAALARTPREALPDLRLADLDRVRASLALARRDEQHAVELARAALGSYEEAQRSPRDLMAILLLLARAENERGASDAALAAAERALALATEARGDRPHSADVGSAELERARALAGRGESAAARPALAAAIANLEAAAGPASPDLARAQALRDAIGVPAG